MRIGGKEFDLKKNTYIMGILNVTPDSFSDGGRYDGLDRAIEHAKQMIQEGVDIIDVGGESTRPGHVQITEEEEIARVVPVIRKLKKEFDIPVSIDTYKSAVAAAAIEAGADLVNDIWGLKYDSKMAGLIAKTGVACCLMHNRENTDYQNFLADFMDDMKECVKIAKDAGIADDRIILDPGVGFGKTYEMNLEIIDKLEIMKELGYPVLLGTSRKSVIGSMVGICFTFSSFFERPVPFAERVGVNFTDFSVVSINSVCFLFNVGKLCIHGRADAFLDSGQNRLSDQVDIAVGQRTGGVEFFVAVYFFTAAVSGDRKGISPEFGQRRRAFAFRFEF